MRKLENRANAEKGWGDTVEFGIIFKYNNYLRLFKRYKRDKKYIKILFRKLTIK